ncbi:MAG: type II toxin-antitoxin system VapC family toxin [Leeuwenhoekiella sp.]
MLDSNIIIYSSLPDREPLRNWLLEQELYVSEISRLEVLGYHRIKPSDINYFENFFNLSNGYSISEEVISNAIHLRRQKSMSIGDSIIASTSLLYNLVLLTSNVKDFKHLDTLELLDLHDFK